MNFRPNINQKLVFQRSKESFAFMYYAFLRPSLSVMYKDLYETLLEFSINSYLAYLVSFEPANNFINFRNLLTRISRVYSISYNHSQKNVSSPSLVLLKRFSRLAHEKGVSSDQLRKNKTEKVSKEKKLTHRQS